MKTDNTSTEIHKKPLKIKQKRFIESYIKKLGNISLACKEAKIDRGTYYDWIIKEPFKTKFDEAIQEHNDAVQSIILSMAINRDKEMLKFWAKTQMKNRGFTEQINLNHSGELDKKLEVVFIDEIRSDAISKKTKKQ